MAGIWLLQGAQEVAGIIAGSGIVPALQIGLYVNNHAPSWLNTNTAFTECSAAGYVEQDLPFANWTLTAPSTSPVVASALPALFSGTAGDGQTLYGYFVIDVVNDTILYAEEFATPYALPSGVWNYVVVPSFSFGQCGAC